MKLHWSIYSFLRLDVDGERFPTPGSATRANRPGQATPWRTARIWCWPKHPSNVHRRRQHAISEAGASFSTPAPISSASTVSRFGYRARCAPCVIPISGEESRRSTAFADGVISTPEGSRHTLGERRFRLVVNSNRWCAVTQTAKHFMNGRRADGVALHLRYHGRRIVLQPGKTA
jgi:hypothetical protein